MTKKEITFIKDQIDSIIELTGYVKKYSEKGQKELLNETCEDIDEYCQAILVMMAKSKKRGEYENSKLR